MTTDHDRVRAYYGAFDEWARLESPEGALEYRRASAVLRAHLAPASRILDLGGGDDWPVTRPSWPPEATRFWCPQG
jgi:hypothetical protein